MVRPLRAPFATTDSFPFTPDSSQLSPMCSCSVSTPLYGAIFSPPQTMVLKMGSNFSGYIGYLASNWASAKS